MLIVPGPSDYCIKHNKPCTYDRSQHQAKAQKYRKQKASAAEQAVVSKTVQYNGGSNPEGGPPSLASNSFERLSNSSTTVQPIAPDTHVVNAMLGGYLPTDHSAMFTSCQLPVMPYTNHSELAVQPPSFESVPGFESPSFSRKMEHSQLASHTTSSVSSLESSSPPRPINLDYFQLATQPTSFVPSLDSSSPARPMDHAQLAIQPASDQLSSFEGVPSFEVPSSQTMEHSRLATQSTSFEGVPSFGSSSFFRTLNYSQLAARPTYSDGLPSPEVPSFSHHVDPAILQAQFGSHAAHRYEEESTETEDLYSLAEQAVRNLRKAEEDGLIPRGEHGYAANDNTLHK